MKKQHLILIAVLAALLGGCKKNNLPEPYIGLNYFPVNVGHWVEYDVDSVSWDDFTDSMYTFNYQLREVIESIIYDNSGRETLRLERYARLTSNDPWEINDVWTANRSRFIAEKVEENERFIKLAFPVNIRKKWNGNAFNSRDPEEYSYEEIHMPASINGMSFDSTLTVLQVENLFAFSRDVGREQYAVNIGLIHKDILRVSLKENQEVKSGFHVIYNVIGFAGK